MGETAVPSTGERRISEPSTEGPFKRRASRGGGPNNHEKV